MPGRKENLKPKRHSASSAPNDDRLLNREELAAKIGCSVSEIENLKESGLIPFYKIRGMVRYDWREIRGALSEKCARGPTITAEQWSPEAARKEEQLARLEQKVEKLTALLERNFPLQKTPPKIQGRQS